MRSIRREANASVNLESPGSKLGLSVLYVELERKGRINMKEDWHDSLGQSTN